MRDTTLVIMAAGIGSRFGGGIKQLAPVGPNGEIIMDYSIHDALEAGFNKIVFIIRKDTIVIKAEGFKGIGAVCETIGQLAYIYALSANAVAAAPVISAYCAASVLWSRIFLKEKLSWKHYASIAVVFAGIIILGVAEGLAEA